MEFFNFNNPHLIIAIILSVINGILLCFVAGKLLQIIQLSGYKIEGYRIWIKDTKANYVSRLFMLGILSFAAIIVTNAILDGFGDYYSYIGLFFYFYFSIVFVLNMNQTVQKTPLSQTKRMNRLILCLFVLCTLITFGLCALMYKFVPLIKFGIISLTPPLLLLIVPLAHFIMIPIENYIRKKYIKMAKSKLAKMPNLIKIGITGSYGKTTTKHILNVMLSSKYNVCMSPHSFNTPMGLTKVVIKYLKENHTILIAEMGARNVGDIKYLCDLIQPKHAIITSVASQHLATFGTLENVAKTKYELVEAIGDDGIVVFNGESEGAFKLYEKCNKNKLLSGINKADAFVNITGYKTSSLGSEFTLNIEGKSVNCKTKLLGKENLEDIALAAALAYKLGVGLDLLKESIYSLKPLAHRLELSYKNGYTIIDNSFNASVESSYSSLEVLKNFDGTKVIITPGIVELGQKEFEENVSFGRKIAKTCDKVIIVNKTNREAIKKGLQEENFDEQNILLVDTLAKAKEQLTSFAPENSVLLFQNDLPDNYT